MRSAAKEAFKTFDKKHENKIKVGDLEAAMKRLGHNIKPDWLEKVEHMIDSAGKIHEFTTWLFGCHWGGKISQPFSLHITGTNTLV